MSRLKGCLALIGGVVVLIVIVAAVQGSGGSSGPKAKAHQPDTTASSGPKTYAVGQIMTNGAHQTVTVTAFSANSPASGFSTPSPGDMCVQVTVSLRNGDSTPWLDPLDELAVVDASGQSYDDLAFDCAGTSDSIDSLVVGGTAAGALYFEVPATGKLTLQWTPSMLNGTSTYNTLLKAS